MSRVPSIHNLLAHGPDRKRDARAGGHPARTRADAAGVARLFEEYRAFHGIPGDLSGAIAFLDARLGRGESAIFVAEPAGPASAPVGFVQLHPSFSSLGMRRIEILNDLFVAAAWRRAGIAWRLLAAAIGYADGVGAGAVELSTARTNSVAFAVYRAVGPRRRLSQGVECAEDHAVPGR